MSEPQAASSIGSIGKALARVDGPLKVTGTARYASDHNFPNMLYAVPVGATIAKGKVTAIDSSRARQMPGVRAILRRGDLAPNDLQNLRGLFRIVGLTLHDELARERNQVDLAVGKQDRQLPLYRLLDRIADESLDARYRDVLCVQVLPFLHSRLSPNLSAKPPFLMTDAELDETMKAQLEHEKQVSRGKGHLHLVKGPANE